MNYVSEIHRVAGDVCLWHTDTSIWRSVGTEDHANLILSAHQPDETRNEVVAALGGGGSGLAGEGWGRLMQFSLWLTARPVSTTLMLCASFINTSINCRQYSCTLSLYLLLALAACLSLCLLCALMAAACSTALLLMSVGLLCNTLQCQHQCCNWFEATDCCHFSLIFCNLLSIASICGIPDKFSVHPSVWFPQQKWLSYWEVIIVSDWWRVISNVFTFLAKSKASVQFNPYQQCFNHKITKSHLRNFFLLKNSYTPGFEFA